jgi:hypothetical protein
MIKRQATFGDKIGQTFTFLGGVGVGAGLFFILDPQRGAARRAWVRDKMFHGIRLCGRFLDKRVRDLRNRVQGELAERRAYLAEEQVDDDVLVERARAQIGHVLSHPSAVEVSARDGVVMVRGPVLEGEREKIEHRLSETRGVRDFRVEVETHPTAEGVPALQGESRSQRRARGNK